MAKSKKTTQEIIGEIADIKRVAAELRKKYGIELFEAPPISRIPTGIARLDEHLKGGFPMGRTVEMYGIPGAGKTLISLLTIKQAQKMGKHCVFIDAERSFDPEWAQALGVDTKKLLVIKSTVGEDIFEMIIELLRTNPGVIVLDSLASFTTKTELENNMDQVQMAPKARLLAKALPKINTFNKETLIIFINQLRDNLTAMGSFGTSTPGGRSVKHAASIRIRVHTDKDLLYADGKKSGEAIGQIVQYKIEKNKTSVPFRTGSFKLLYDGPTIEG